MGKIIDRILYFFGYAPIYLKTEYKTVIINKDMNFNEIRVVRELDHLSHEQYARNEMRRDIVKEVEKLIEWQVTCMEFPNEKRKINARLFIGILKTK